MSEKDIAEMEALGMSIPSESQQFTMHMVNMGFAAVMLIVGLILIKKYKKGNAATGGWILTGIGITILITHGLQMLLG